MEIGYMEIGHKVSLHEIGYGNLDHRTRSWEFSLLAIEVGMLDYAARPHRARPWGLGHGAWP